MLTELYKRNMGRNKNIDALRGLAAVLVVIGHTIQRNIFNYEDNIIFSMIYSFHMPLFMFISGLVAYQPNREVSVKTLYNRGLSLILPFTSYSVLIYFFKKYYKEKALLVWIFECIRKPDLSLWFLWILFFNYVFLFYNIFNA